MNTTAGHIAQAEYNETFFLHLQQSARQYQDWQVTCLFYAALHYIDAYLHQLNPPAGIHPRGHHPRMRMAETHLGLSLAQDYQELQDRSQDARYEGRRFTDAQVTSWYLGEFARIRAALSLPE